VLGTGPQRVGSLDVLATRPDGGRSLVVLTLEDLMTLLGPSGRGAHVECKRFHAFAHHTIFEGKF